MPYLSPNVWADADRSTPRVILDLRAGDMQSGTANVTSTTRRTFPTASLAFARRRSQAGASAGLAWAN